MLTQNQEEIVNSLGADDWQGIVDEYLDWSFDRILADLNHLYPNDDNDALAQLIVAELR